MLVVCLCMALVHVCFATDMYCGEESSCYEVLGVYETAETTDIRRAYRKLSLQYHPDRNSDPSAQATFITIARAYEILSNDETRSDYDYYLKHPEDRLYNSYAYYKAEYGPRTDIRVVAIGILLIFECIEFLLKWDGYHRTVRNNYKLQADIRNRTKIASKAAKGKGKQTNTLNNESICKEVCKEYHELGILKKPILSDLLLFQVVHLPRVSFCLILWLKRQITARIYPSVLEEISPKTIYKTPDIKPMKIPKPLEQVETNQKIEAFEAELRAAEELKKEQLEEKKQRRFLENKIVKRCGQNHKKDIRYICEESSVSDLQMILQKLHQSNDPFIELQEQVKIAKKKEKDSFENAFKPSERNKGNRKLNKEQRELLIKALKKFPGGSRGRWNQIANYINNAGVSGDLLTDVDCTKEAARLKQNPEIKVRQEDSVTWSLEEQKQLEAALLAYPSKQFKDTKERWKHISSQVSTKSLKECVQRFKEIRSKLKERNESY